MSAKRTIYLCQGISTGSAMATVPLLEKFAAESKEDIYMIIDSYGGSIPAMLAITDAMERCPCDIVTIAKGKVMSAGSFIAASGTKGKRFAFVDTHFMFHQPNGGAEYRQLGGMDFCREITERKLSEVSGMSIAEVEKITKEDTYYWPEGLVGSDFNVLDGIIGVD